MDTDKTPEKQLHEFLARADTLHDFGYDTASASSRCCKHDTNKCGNIVNNNKTYFENFKKEKNIYYDEYPKNNERRPQYSDFENRVMSMLANFTGDDDYRKRFDFKNNAIEVEYNPGETIETKNGELVCVKVPYNIVSSDEKAKAGTKRKREVMGNTKYGVFQTEFEKQLAYIIPHNVGIIKDFMPKDPLIYYDSVMPVDSEKFLLETVSGEWDSATKQGGVKLLVRGNKTIEVPNTNITFSYEETKEGESPSTWTWIIKHSVEQIAAYNNDELKYTSELNYGNRGVPTLCQNNISPLINTTNMEIPEVTLKTYDIKRSGDYGQIYFTKAVNDSTDFYILKGGSNSIDINKCFLLTDDRLCFIKALATGTPSIFSSRSDMFIKYYIYCPVEYQTIPIEQVQKLVENLYQTLGKTPEPEITLTGTQSEIKITETEITVTGITGTEIKITETETKSEPEPEFKITGIKIKINSEEYTFEEGIIETSEYIKLLNLLSDLNKTPKEHHWLVLSLFVNKSGVNVDIPKVWELNDKVDHYNHKIHNHLVKYVNSKTIGKGTNRKYVVTSVSDQQKYIKLKAYFEGSDIAAINSEWHSLYTNKEHYLIPMSKVIQYILNNSVKKDETGAEIDPIFPLERPNERDLLIKCLDICEKSPFLIKRVELKSRVDLGIQTIDNGSPLVASTRRIKIKRVISSMLDVMDHVIYVLAGNTDVNSYPQINVSTHIGAVISHIYDNVADQIISEYPVYTDVKQQQQGGNQPPKRPPEEELSSKDFKRLRPEEKQRDISSAIENSIKCNKPVPYNFPQARMMEFFIREHSLVGYKNITHDNLLKLLKSNNMTLPDALNDMYGCIEFSYIKQLFERLICNKDVNNCCPDNGNCTDIDEVEDDCNNNGVITTKDSSQQVDLTIALIKAILKSKINRVVDAIKSEEVENIGEKLGLLTESERGERIVIKVDGKEASPKGVVTNILDKMGIKKQSEEKEVEAGLDYINRIVNINDKALEVIDEVIYTLLDEHEPPQTQTRGGKKTLQLNSSLVKQMLVRKVLKKKGVHLPGVGAGW